MYLYPGDPGYNGDGIDLEYVPDPPPPVVYPPVLLTATLPSGSKGAVYDQFIVAYSGTPAYTFAVTTGALPTGLALNAATGEITGTPTASGSFTFIVRITDSNALTANATFTILIPTVPAIINPSLPDGSVGTPYSVPLSGQGGAQPYGFQVIAGTLPPGLNLAVTGGITGTPTTAGTFAFTVQIYDSNAPQGTGSTAFSITIALASLANPTTTLDEVFLLGKEDGGLYAIIPGQRHDEDINAHAVGFLQQWQGVRGPSQGGLVVLQLGGASVSAIGNGPLTVYAIDNNAKLIYLSKPTRQMNLSSTETVRDFALFPAPQSERFGIGFNNGGIADNWFELHTAMTYLRKLFSSRKA